MAPLEVLYWEFVFTLLPTVNYRAFSELLFILKSSSLKAFYILLFFMSKSSIIKMLVFLCNLIVAVIPTDLCCILCLSTTRRHYCVSANLVWPVPSPTASESPDDPLLSLNGKLWEIRFLTVDPSMRSFWQDRSCSCHICALGQRLPSAALQRLPNAFNVLYD